MADPHWFRAPSDGDPGTLNACYEALDIHVIRGRADDVALVLDGAERTYAWLLTEVAACAGVLRAFGVDVGDQVALGAVPHVTGVITVLAAARVGAVVQHDDSAGAEGAVVVRSSDGRDGGGGDDGEVVFAVGPDEVPWEVAMRAGRTDPAGCADVPGDAVLARHADSTLTVLDALGVAPDVPGAAAVPPGASPVEVGGVTFWWFDAD